MKNDYRFAAMKFSKVYPLYVAKVERKNRTKEEVDKVICWLTGYSMAGLQQQIKKDSSFETFFAEAPAIHPNSSLIQREQFTHSFRHRPQFNPHRKLHP